MLCNYSAARDVLELQCSKRCTATTVQHAMFSNLSAESRKLCSRGAREAVFRYFFTLTLHCDMDILSDLSTPVFTSTQRNE